VKQIKQIVFMLILAGVFTFSLTSAILPENDHSSSEEKEAVSVEKNKPEHFDAEKMIMGHVLDAYEWHLFSIKDKHISVPLPVILYSKNKGWNFFMSSRFHHGHESYKGFRIAEEGPYKGKIVEIAANGEEIRPLDLSLTKTAVALLFSVFLLLWVFLSIANKYKKEGNKAPHGLQNLLEPLIIFIRDEVAEASIGEKYEKYLPYLLTLFFFIFFNNLLGLIPILPAGANVTGNIAIPIVMALFTFAIVVVSANKYFWIDIFNTPGVPWWLKFPIPLIPLIEFSSLFIKHIVLVIRLFANIVAGHIVALGFFALIFIFGEMNILAGYGISVVTIAFTVFLALLELLVAFIQAYVFTLLSALYIGLALEEGH
jgi:F-type H+-transporting ATPase subunit a